MPIRLYTRIVKLLFAEIFKILLTKNLIMNKYRLVCQNVQNLITELLLQNFIIFY